MQARHVAVKLPIALSPVVITGGAQTQPSCIIDHDRPHREQIQLFMTPSTSSPPKQRGTTNRTGSAASSNPTRAPGTLSVVWLLSSSYSLAVRLPVP